MFCVRESRGIRNRSEKPGHGENEKATTNSEHQFRILSSQQPIIETISKNMRTGFSIQALLFLGAFVTL